MASSKKYNPMDDLTPYSNLPSSETRGGPPQRSTPRRGSKQGMVDRYRNDTGREPDPTMSERAATRKKFTMSKKDQELDAKVQRLMEEERRSIEMQIGQREVDRLVAEGYFDEDDTSGMRGGGAVMGYAKGGMTGRDGCAIKGKTKGRMV